MGCATMRKRAVGCSFVKLGLRNTMPALGHTSFAASQQYSGASWSPRVHTTKMPASFLLMHAPCGAEHQQPPYNTNTERSMLIRQLSSLSVSTAPLACSSPHATHAAALPCCARTDAWSRLSHARLVVAAYMHRARWPLVILDMEGIPFLLEVTAQHLRVPSSLLYLLCSWGACCASACSRQACVCARGQFT
jgi:hypothetical protein